jgi:hypothetical protein
MIVARTELIRIGRGRVRAVLVVRIRRPRPRPVLVARRDRAVTRPLLSLPFRQHLVRAA